MGNKIFYLSLSIFLGMFISACNVYKSPDRREFESDYSSAQLTSKIDALAPTECGSTSILTEQPNARLISVEYIVDSDNPLFNIQLGTQTFYELKTLQGTYCRYVQL